MVRSIGNGIWARIRRRESLLEGYRRKQATCGHSKRDPYGTCYACGERRAAVGLCAVCGGPEPCRKRSCMEALMAQAEYWDGVTKA